MVDHIDLQAGNRQVREDFANGVSGIWLQLGGGAGYSSNFLAARNVNALQSVLDGVPLDQIELYISGGMDGIPAAALLTALIEQNGTARSKIRGSAGLDPLSYAAATGQVPALRSCVMADAVDAATYLREAGYGWTPFLVSSRMWHQAGGSSRDELGFTLAAAVFYWRGLIEAGWPLGDAADAISFSLCADSDLFITIAKLRALRALWARVTEAAGLPPKRARVLCEMSLRMMTERDPYVNVLRATSAAFGAGAGGADAVLLHPYNACYSIPDGFARSLARNTQLILQEEASLGRVADPAGGSAYVETLTHELAARSWGLFREAEAHGGMLAALDKGFVNRTLTDTALRRKKDLAHNRTKMTGTSSFPDLDERLVYSRPQDMALDLTALEDELALSAMPCPNRGKRFAAMVAAAQGGATLTALEQVSKRLVEKLEFIPSPHQRLAEPFEKLRLASDRALSRVMTRPPVFLANLGALEDYAASANFARNVLAAGGIQALDQGGFMTVDALIRAFQRSPAPVACICAAQSDLARMRGVPAALKEAGAAAIYLSGAPSLLPGIDQTDRLLIDRIIYEGCNMLAVLTELHEIMSVNELADGEPEDFADDDTAPDGAIPGLSGKAR